MDIYTGTQIEFSKDLTPGEPTHGIFTLHSSTEVANNKLLFTVWNPITDEGKEVSENAILELNPEGIKTVHILPTEPTKYNLGSLDARWRILIGSELFTDRLQTKTINLYSGI